MTPGLSPLWRQSSIAPWQSTSACTTRAPPGLCSTTSVLHLLPAQRALVDGTRAAWVQQDGTMLHTGSAEDLSARLRALTEDWHQTGQPPASCWRADFTQHPDLDPPLLMPRQWQLHKKNRI